MPPSVHASPTPKLSAFVAPIAVRAAALWILAVSFIKATKGGPGALPLIVRENPLGEDLTFYLTLSIEFAFSLAALVSTRVGWWLMMALLGVFLSVLAHLVWIGATSCGCFGGAIKFSPYQMLAVDAPLFVILLLARKGAWNSKAKLPLAALGAAMLIGALAPMFLVDNTGGAAPLPTDRSSEASPRSNGDSPNATTPSNPDARVASVDEPTPNESSTAASTSSEDPMSQGAPGPWKLPATKPRWVKLRPPEWVGKSIHQTELGAWMDTRSLPDTARWILFLQTCTHCRDYLNRLEAAFGSDPQVYVLVTLATEQDEAEGIIQQTPPHEAGALPPDIQWVVGPELPPWELVLEGGVVIEAIHHDVDEAGLDKRTHWRLEGDQLVESASQFQY
jgi:hypothetical protein